MHTVGHHGFSGPFGRSNEPRSEHTPHFDDFRVLLHTIFWVIGIPMSKMQNLFVDVHQDVVYAYGWPSRLFRPIWKVKRALKRAYPSFRQFSCAIANHFLGDPYSDVKNVKFFVDVFQDLVYASNWPARPFRPILKVKRVPKQAYLSFRRLSCAITNHFLSDPNFDVKNAKFVRGHPSRRCLCIWLAITAFPTHLEGQTSPEASIRLILTIFVCYYTPFLGDRDSDVKNAKFVRGRPSRCCLYIWLAITAFPTHLEGQTSPEASIPLISTIFVCYSTPFFE